MLVPGEKVTLGNLEFSGPRAGKLMQEAQQRLIDARTDRTSIHLRCRECGDVACQVLVGWIPKGEEKEK